MLTRFSYLFLILTLAISAFLFVNFTRKDSENSATFLGVGRCRVCHEAVSSGNQFGRWLESPHSQAFAALASDSAVAYVKSHGGSSRSCFGCHTTLGRPGLSEVEHALNKEGVGCERCHGAGSRYSYFNVMKDHPAFLSNGGVSGALQDCYQCHARSLQAEGSHCPFQTADFLADSAWVRIRHSMPEQAEPDTVLYIRKP
jgi:hypothetical protein